MSEIQNKVVIITGASSGLGAATAERLAASGAKLMLAARREDRLKEMVAAILQGRGYANERSGWTATYLVTDVTDLAQVEALAKETVSTYGRIDVLINSAGVMPLSPLDKVKVKEWDRTIDVNIKGVLYGIAAVLPIMRQQKSGHIINLSSVAGHQVYPGSVVYCATKFAVRAISEGLRLESNSEIRSTNISPGPVATELTNCITDRDTATSTNAFYAKTAIDADAIARAIAYAIEQPGDVDVNEITVSPTRQA